MESTLNQFRCPHDLAVSEVKLKLRAVFTKFICDTVKPNFESKYKHGDNPLRKVKHDFITSSNLELIRNCISSRLTLVLDKDFNDCCSNKMDTTQVVRADHKILQRLNECISLFGIECSIARNS